MLIQQIVRRMLCNRSDVLRQKCNAATLLQRNYRRFFCQTSYSMSIRSVIRIQCCFRSTQSRSITNYRRSIRKHVVLIQSIYRRRIVHRNFLKTRVMIVRVQQVARRMFKGKAAVRIQRACRRFIAHRTYKATIASAISIQTMFRRYSAFIRVKYMKQNNSARRIQSLFRMKTIQSQYSSLVCASLLLQAQVRGMFARQKIFNYQKAIATVVYLQARWRRNICRCRYMTILCSIRNIQRCVRGLLHRRKAQTARVLKISLIKIQRVWRLRYEHDKVAKARNEANSMIGRSVQQITGPYHDQCDPQPTLIISKNGSRVALGNLNASKLKVNTRRGQNNVAMSTMNASNGSCNLREHNSTQNIISERNTENIKPERKSVCKMNRAVLAVKDFSTVVKQINDESILLDVVDDQKDMLNEIEKLKVVDLRHELKSYGVESKTFSKLRKAELVTMVLEQRKVQTITIS